jgi:hypothetical protein
MTALSDIRTRFQPGLFILALTLASSTVHAGTLAGTVVGDWDGQGLKNVTVRACAAGRSIVQTALSDANGDYRIENLPAGTYAVCVAQSESNRPCIVTGVEVRETGEALIDLRVNRSFAIEDDTWTRPYQRVSQSFRATGLCLTGLTLKAFGPGRTVRVQVHDGISPDAPSLGPGRSTVPFGGEGRTTVVWSGGEIPTVPGKTYTITMESAAEGWQPGMAGGGDVYPYGHSWLEGSPRPFGDIGMVVFEDNDGLATNYSIQPQNRYWRVVSAGQTFEAQSSNVVYVLAYTERLDNDPMYLRFSIHRGAPQGMQIGPSKVAPAGGQAAVVWNRDEVSLLPGERYALHVESTDGRMFRIGVAKDQYQRGTALFNAVPNEDWDLAVGIMGDTNEDDLHRLWAVAGAGHPVPLENPSFENGLEGWTKEGWAGAVVGCTDHIVPPWGERMFGYTAHGVGQDRKVKVFQEVKVKSGRRYTLSASVLANQAGGRSSDVMAQLFIYPGTAESLDENADVVTSGRYATQGGWQRASVECTAERETMVVGVEFWQRWPLAGNALYVDGFHLQVTEEQ